MPDNTVLLLNTLGLAKRAGRIMVGQDHVFAELRKHIPLLVIVSDDCSANVLRSVDAGAERGEVTKVVLRGIDRNALGAAMGLKTAQVAALSLQDGFAKKVLSLQDRSEQSPMTEEWYDFA